MPVTDRSSSHADRSLAEGLRRRDPATIAGLHAAYGRTVMGFLVRTLGDRGAAEDVFQQVFLEAWQRGAAYDPERAAPLTWLMAITRSRAIDHLRRRVPEPHDPTGSPALFEGTGEPEGGIDALLEQWRLAHLLGRLSEAEADVLRRRFYDGATQQEIAAATGIPLGTVKMRMVQGLARLRELIDAEEQGRMSAREQLSDYLLDELSAAERERFEAELAHDPELAAEAERLRPIVSRLDGVERTAWDAAAVEVPPLALPGMSAPPAPARTRWWHRPLVLRPAAAGALAAVLLGLGVLGGLLVTGGDEDQAASGGRVVALAPVEPLGGEATGTATFASSGERATIRLAGLPPSAEGEFYELWLLNSAEDLVALGSFEVPASGSADVTVPVPAGLDDFAALDVSVEPADGNPAHSSRSVLRAPLAAS